jgi:hypothetical protein
MKKTFLQIMLIVVFLFLTSGCANTHKSMDIVSPGFVVDDNFLLKNPVWGTIADKRTTTNPAPGNFCPCGSGDPNKWTSAPDCTNQDVSYNDYYWANAIGCPDGAHMNYFPIAYEGSICWGDHSGADDDYNFRIRRKDEALNTAGWDGFMQTEFDSDETVDHWDDTGTWWNDFHHNKVDQSDGAAHEAIDGKFAIVIGEAGMDYEHGCHIELHPVYAMFVHVKDDPNDDHWAFFVRNWGDEGYCGNNQIYYRNLFTGDNTITIRLPHEHATLKSFTQNIRSVNDHNHKTFLLFSPVPDGLMLRFSLDAPEEHTTIVGDINIQWTATDGPLKPRNDGDNLICSGLGVSSQPLSSSDDSSIDMRMLKLDSLSKTELHNRLNEQFGSNALMKSDITVVKRSNIEVKNISRSQLKETNYSKMVYQVPDSVTSKRKYGRLQFIKEYLNGKKLN